MGRGIVAPSYFSEAIGLYYKVIKDNRVIDVLDKLIFLKYQKKHNRMLISSEEDAQAILSSDGNYAWHTMFLNKIPVSGYDTVEIKEIDQYEYDKLKCLNLKTPEAIIDEFVLTLLEDGVL